MFTEEQIAKADEHPTLGVEYFAARDIAQRFMEHWQSEHLFPLVEVLSKTIYEKVQEDFENFLLSDAEANIQSHIRQVAEGVVGELLGGYRRSLDKHVLLKNFDGEAIRKQIADLIPREIMDARIADLEAENEQLKADIKWLRD